MEIVINSRKRTVYKGTVLGTVLIGILTIILTPIVVVGGGLLLFALSIDMVIAVTAPFTFHDLLIAFSGHGVFYQWFGAIFSICMGIVCWVVLITYSIKGLRWLWKRIFKEAYQ